MKTLDLTKQFVKLNLQTIIDAHCVNDVDAELLLTHNPDLIDELVTFTTAYDIDVGGLAIKDGKVFEVNDVNGADLTFELKNPETKEEFAMIDYENYDFFSLDFDYLDEATYEFLCFIEDGEFLDEDFDE